MSKRIDAKIKSYQFISDVLASNSILFESNESIKTQIEKFTNYAATFKSIHSQMNKPTQWLTQEKDELFSVLVKNMEKLRIALVCYANDNDNHVLIDEAKSQCANVRREAAVIRLNSARRICNLAKEYEAGLASYAINPEFVADNLKIIKDIINKIEDRSIIKTQNKQNRNKIEDLIKSIDEFLREKLDWSIKRYNESHPQMVSDYFSSRMLKKGNHNNIDLRGYIVDKESGLSIPFGKVSAVGCGLYTKINEKGNFTFKKFPEGESTLKVENINYETTVVSIRRCSNQHLHIKIEMQALPVPRPA
ncbi:carboxypeptidase-like regulatory domain-containing protein [Marinifilum sp.]|uniref:carboxypeptidase-like regulatory domain-containing protein n=1 Tax=Marinifilum sp. TaxID=2033137 RepID=UPI003BAAC160